MKKILLLFTILVFNIYSIFCEPLKVVFTGGPGTGKTTLINALAERGFLTVQEAATSVIKEEQSNGIEFPWVDMNRFQLAILERGLFFLNQALTKAQEIGAGVLFLDRAIPDAIAYFNLNKMVAPEAIIKGSRDIKYDRIFILDFLDIYESTAVRREGVAEARQIHNLLISAYELLGYEVIHIPAMSVEGRVKFVLQELGKYNPAP